MNTELQTFEFQSHQLTVITDEHGEPWFIAMEVAEILEYSDANKMTSKLDEDEVQNRQIGGFGNRGVNIINESGLWSSVLRSTKPEAKEFKKWLTSEVLPSIRKTGGYIAPNSELARELDAARELLNTQRLLIASQKNEVLYIKSQAETLVKDAFAQVKHKDAQLALKNNEVVWLVGDARRYRENMARALRSKHPMTELEEEEIYRLHYKGHDLPYLEGYFHRSRNLIKRAIRNQGGVL